MRSSMINNRLEKISPTLVMAKKKKNMQSKQDVDQVNSWYEQIDDDATPDDVFREERERQKLSSDVDFDTPIDTVG
eukprot:CAMPEP_0197838054 /NCGR_PEP_ID=MMETSP1437-20131217/34120_1 /TAXON_ID=49252 ORGANISM="Eucampia antarctica, Strain CCMP1452" /NCGR_SAMPLE_ID=MMETSP1437 /ASSEMBLY_ACC=CAM_ASM_001096 /LENGTH=75 /DNA_ID=CAMNT_0043445575 /DNA_START=163 /DNA_END=386 /DNA_ORIENTATION=-